MKSRLVHSFTLMFAVCGPALSAQSSPSPPATAAFSAKRFEAGAVAPPALSATVVEYGERDVLRLKAKLRYTTLIVLPKNEQILDFTCGDKEFWIVNGTQNFAYVKPARANSQTNLNLITASGNVYSFVLNEISGRKTPPSQQLTERLQSSAVIIRRGSSLSISLNAARNRFW